jgi:hypothetical protein
MIQISGINQITVINALVASFDHKWQVIKITAIII